MGFSSRVAAIDKSVDNGNENSGYENTPGVYKCTVTEVEESPEDHTGSPYLNFKMKTDDSKMISAKLWVAKDDEDETKANNKDNRIKKFFDGLGVEIPGKTGGELMLEAVGKQIMCAFQAREYVGKNKDTNEPEIKTILNFYYSGKVGEKISDLNESNYKQVLSTADERKFKDMKALWLKQNPKAAAAAKATSTEGTEATDGVEKKDDLPF